MTARLFTELQLGELTLSNRICVPPMCQFRAEEGLVQSWHKVHYGKLVGSGAGMVVVEATAVTPEGRITPKCLGLWNDAQQEAFKSLVQDCRAVAADTKLFLQLSHAGRKGSRCVPWEGHETVAAEKGGFSLIAPSALAYDKGYPTPREMTGDDIERVISAFADAAQRAHKAGFDGVQIHAAHGYLIHQFLSPLSNQRTDEWGGSLENRMRFGLEVIKAVRERVPNLAVVLRVSATDWVEGGWDESSTVAFVRAAKTLGCIGVDVSAGGCSPLQHVPAVRPGYQVCYARDVKRATAMITFAVGLITDPLQAEATLDAGEADVICVGREMLRNPHWGWMAAQALHALVPFPPPYLPAF